MDLITQNELVVSDDRRRICLATKDAHGLYSQFQFKVTETPQNWMEIKDNNVYQKSQLGLP